MYLSFLDILNIVGINQESLRVETITKYKSIVIVRDHLSVVIFLYFISIKPTFLKKFYLKASTKIDCVCKINPIG